MFESAELRRVVDKATYDAEVPALRASLLEAQLDVLERASFPVIILIGGVDGAGKGETVNLLNEWMDPRHIQTHGLGAPGDEERQRPRMWRFWRVLPPRGRIGIYFGSWYTVPILDRVLEDRPAADLEHRLAEIVRFEQMLVDEGALILKLWFHLSKKAQKRRLRSLEKDPRTRWRVTREDWQRFAQVDRFHSVCEHVLRRTSTAEAPWIVVSGEDARHRNLTVGRTLLGALRGHLDRPTPPPIAVTVGPGRAPNGAVTLLGALDQSRTVSPKDYRRELETWQGRLNLIARSRRMRRHALLAVFEGNDAAGKGGAIRRVTAALDARFCRVTPFAAPTEEERAQPFLWRFWRQLPRRGHVALFDRSWYGRVLVERVEGFCAEADWRRAYSEINDFEAQLVEHGIVVVKFWLAITKDEQLRRFEERQATPFKRFKITEEDWRNREKWELYEQAVCDMVEQTSTAIARWTLVEANDKRHARIKVLRTLCESLEAVL